MNDIPSDERRRRGTDPAPGGRAEAPTGGEGDVIAARSGGSAGHGPVPLTPQPDETPWHGDRDEEESAMPEAEPEIGPTS